MSVDVFVRMLVLASYLPEEFLKGPLRNSQEYYAYTSSIMSKQ